MSFLKDRYHMRREQKNIDCVHRSIEGKDKNIENLKKEKIHTDMFINKWQKNPFFVRFFESLQCLEK